MNKKTVHIVHQTPSYNSYTTGFASFGFGTSEYIKRSSLVVALVEAHRLGYTHYATTENEKVRRIPKVARDFKWTVNEITRSKEILDKDLSCEPESLRVNRRLQYKEHVAIIKLARKSKITG